MPGERIPLGARLRARLEVEKAECSVKDEAQTTLPPPNETKPLQTTLPPPHFTPPTAASLLGIDFAKGLGGECFTCGGEAAPARSAKLALQEALLSNSNRQLDRRPRSDKHVLRGGMVRLSPRLPAFNFVDKLGECGDARCGCYRLYRPDIRKHFRDVVSQTTLGQLSRSKLQRLRYVTVGSGSLLTDFEILCALDSLGVAATTPDPPGPPPPPEDLPGRAAGGPDVPAGRDAPQQRLGLRASTQQYGSWECTQEVCLRYFGA